MMRMMVMMLTMMLAIMVMMMVIQVMVGKMDMSIIARSDWTAVER